MVLKMKVNHVLINGQLCLGHFTTPYWQKNKIFVFSQKWLTNKNGLSISSYAILLQNNEFYLLSNLFPNRFYISFWRKKTDLSLCTSGFDWILTQLSTNNAFFSHLKIRLAQINEATSNRFQNLCQINENKLTKRLNPGFGDNIMRDLQAISEQEKHIKFQHS